MKPKTLHFSSSDLGASSPQFLRPMPNSESNNYSQTGISNRVRTLCFREHAYGASQFGSPLPQSGWKRPIAYLRYSVQSLLLEQEKEMTRVISKFSNLSTVEVRCMNMSARLFTTGLSNILATWRSSRETLRTIVLFIHIQSTPALLPHDLHFPNLETLSITLCNSSNPPQSSVLAPTTPSSLLENRVFPFIMRNTSCLRSLEIFYPDVDFTTIFRELRSVLKLKTLSFKLPNAPEINLSIIKQFLESQCNTIKSLTITLPTTPTPDACRIFPLLSHIFCPMPSVQTLCVNANPDYEVLAPPDFLEHLLVSFGALTYLKLVHMILDGDTLVSFFVSTPGLPSFSTLTSVQVKINTLSSTLMELFATHLVALKELYLTAFSLQRHAGDHDSRNGLEVRPVGEIHSYLLN